MEERKSPIKKYTLSNIECAVWRNVAQDGTEYFQFSFQKSYKDKNDEWQQTRTFNRTDLAIIAALCNKVLAVEIKAREVKAKQQQAAPAPTPAPAATPVNSQQSYIDSDPGEDIPF